MCRESKKKNLGEFTKPVYIFLIEILEFDERYKIKTYVAINLSQF